MVSHRTCQVLIKIRVYLSSFTSHQQTSFDTSSCSSVTLTRFQLPITSDICWRESRAQKVIIRLRVSRVKIVQKFVNCKRTRHRNIFSDEAHSRLTQWGTVDDLLLLQYKSSWKRILGSRASPRSLRCYEGVQKVAPACKPLYMESRFEFARHNQIFPGSRWPEPLRSSS